MNNEKATRLAALFKYKTAIETAWNRLIDDLEAIEKSPPYKKKRKEVIKE